MSKSSWPIRKSHDPKSLRSKVFPLSSPLVAIAEPELAESIRIPVVELAKSSPLRCFLKANPIQVVEDKLSNDLMNVISEVSKAMLHIVQEAPMVHWPLVHRSPHSIESPTCSEVAFIHCDIFSSCNFRSSEAPAFELSLVNMPEEWVGYQLWVMSSGDDWCKSTHVQLEISTYHYILSFQQPFQSMRILFKILFPKFFSQRIVEN